MECLYLMRRMENIFAIDNRKRSEKVQRTAIIHYSEKDLHRLQCKWVILAGIRSSALLI